MATPVLTWEHHRFYADDNATLNNCTALADQDAILDRQTGTANRFIVRLGMSNDASANFNATIAFEYELNDSGTWVQIDTTTAGRCVATTAGLATDDTSVGATGVLTGMTETTYDESGLFNDTDGVTASTAIAKSRWGEDAICCYLVDAEVSDNDSIKIRCNAASGTEAWDAAGEANVTVDKSGTPDVPKAGDDSGTLAEAITGEATPADSDSATEADANDPVASAVPASDAATFAVQQTQQDITIVGGYGATLTDTGVQTSGVTNVAKDATDAGTLAEAVAITTTPNDSDSGSLAEAASLANRPAASDSGSLADTGAKTVSAQKTANDTLTLADSSSLATTLVVAATDSVTLASVAALATNPSDTDSATLSETSATTTPVSGTDTGTLADSGSIDKTQAKSGADTLTLADASSLANRPTTSDTASLADSGATDKAVGKSAIDTLTLADAGSLANDPAASDSGSVAEAESTIATPTATDTVSLTDSGTVDKTQAKSATESGTVSDTASQTSVAGASDSATLTDTAEVDVGGVEKTGTDTFTASDVAGLPSDTWGYTAVGSLDTDGGSTRAMSNTFNELAPAQLDGITIRIGGTHVDQIRLAVYVGGDLGTGPAGATLLEDLGLTTGSATDTWVTVNSLTHPIIPNGQPVWVCYKWTGTTEVAYAPDEPGTHDFQGDPTGRWLHSGSIDNDENVAWPSTWPADSGSYGSSWVSVYINFRAGAIQATVEASDSATATDGGSTDQAIEKTASDTFTLADTSAQTTPATASDSATLTDTAVVSARAIGVSDDLAFTDTTVFLRDFFNEDTDTELSLHTPDEGRAWVSRFAQTATVDATNNWLSGDSPTSDSFYYNLVRPAGDDYYIEADVYLETDNDRYTGLVAHFGGPDNYALYQVLWHNSLGVWRLETVMPSVGTTILDTWAGDDPLTSTVTVRLNFSGATVSVLFNGTQRISLSDTTRRGGYTGVKVRDEARLDNLVAGTAPMLTLVAEPGTNDTLTLADAAAVVQGGGSVFGSDTGTITEDASVTATLTATDSATLTDTDSVDEGGAKSATDTLTFAEKQTQQDIALTTVYGATLTDSGSVDQGAGSPTASDSATLSSDVVGAATVAATDSATLASIGSVVSGAVTKEASDSATLSDTGTRSQVVTASDSLALTDNCAPLPDQGPIGSGPGNSLVTGSNQYPGTGSPYWVKLGWEHGSNNRDGYRIYRRVVGGTFALLDTTTSNTYTDNGPFNPGVTYDYTATIYNDYGETSYRGIHSIAPIAPIFLADTATLDESAALDKPTGVDTFTLSEQGVATFPTTPLASDTFTVTDNAAPVPDPGPLTVSWITSNLYPGTGSPYTAVATWDHGSSNRDGYRIYRTVRDHDGNVVNARAVFDTTTSNTWTDTGPFNPGWQYAYEVTIYNAHGETAFSGSVNLQPINQSVLVDSATLTEASTFDTEKDNADAGTLTESTIVTVEVSGTDAVTTTDSRVLAAVVSATDTQTLSEAIAPTDLSLVDTFTLAESGTLAQVVIGVDALSLADAGVLVQTIIGTDIITMLDTESVVVPITGRAVGVASLAIRLSATTTIGTG